jgi:hypothetical protein
MLEGLMKKPVYALSSIMIVGLCIFASPGQAEVVRACQVENPPANCDRMWAVIAHVRLPKQPIAAAIPNPGCGSKFDSINWGRTVADAFLAEADPITLKKLAMDVSGALQQKLVPEISRHIRGDAGIFIENNFSKLTPKAWSLSSTGYDLALCAPVIAAVPADATVTGFRFRVWDENRGEMDCKAGSLECDNGSCRFNKTGRRPTETSMDGIRLYTVIFQNWSTDLAREGRMILFFEMPAGKVPLLKI